MKHAGNRTGIGLALANAGADRRGRDLGDAAPARALESNAVSTEDEPIDDLDDADLDRVIRSEIYGSLSRCGQFATSPSTPRDAGIRPGQSLRTATRIISRLGGEVRALSG